MKILTKIKITFYIIVALVIMALAAFFVHGFRSTSISVEQEQTINGTPISIERMRQIGQWEFLSLSVEELVDTTRRRLFTTDELVRIYYGELRLGIDMSEIADEAFRTEGDSIILTLPEVRLLDENFIDEARTRSFYESGSWDNKAREALYEKARRRMKERCLTPENYASARRNAKAQTLKMLRTLGIENAKVE